MVRILMAIVIGAVAIGLYATTSVFADRVYHSERLELSVTAEGEAAGHPALRVGQVVNIHPNGPVIGALEEYMIGGASPNTDYGVVIAVFEECGGAFLMPLPTTTLSTDSRGNAHGSATFSAEDLEPFSGAVLGAQWKLMSGGLAAYQSECTVVSID